MDATVTLQWLRAFFFFLKISVCLNLGSNVHTTVFVSVSSYNWRSNQLGHYVLERLTFNLRLEELNLCGVHARSRGQQYTQRGRKHDSNKSSLIYYIYL